MGSLGMDDGDDTRGMGGEGGGAGGRSTKVRGLGVFSMKSEGFVSIFNEKRGLCVFGESRIRGLGCTGAKVRGLHTDTW